MIAINSDKCIECKKCERVCPVSGIDISTATINEDCIQCHHCAAVCSENAIGSQNIIGNASQNNIQPYDFELLMQQRRTHRDFSSKPLSPSIIKEFINHLRYSPTASNRQSLHFTVITNDEQLNRINQLTIETLTKAFNAVNWLTKPLLKLLKGKSVVQTIEQSKTKFLNKAARDNNMITYNAPALIVIHSEEVPVGMPCHDANIWTGMAILYAELIDLCTCVNGYIVNAAQKNKKLKQCLQIPDNHKVYSTILIGYPKGKFENIVERNLPNIHFLN